MELTGDSLIAADRGRVWAALTDPVLLARCVAGVDSRGATTGADGTTTAHAGPIHALFLDGVALTEADPPRRCVFAGDGSGGDCAHRTEITLSEAAGDNRTATRLRYVVTSHDGASARPSAGELDAFFARLKTEVERSVAPSAVRPADLDAVPRPAVAPPSSPDDAKELHGVRTATGLTPLVWAAVVVLVVLAVLVWQLR